MAVQTLLSARAGLETTRNTGVTPTRLVYFESGTHSQDIGTIRPLEKRASYVEGFRSYPGIERNIINLEGAATFDDLIWYANLHMKAVAAGAGGGADKTWTFLPTHTSDDLKSATLQFGYTDNIGATLPAWSLPGCLGEELTLTWAKDSTLRFASKLMTAKAASQISAFTGALSDRTTIDATGPNTQVFIDTTTLGSTSDGNVMAASFTLTNGLTYLDALDNTSVANSLLRTKPKTFRLQLTRYYANDTELDAYVAKTLRKIRIRTLGPTLGGSTYKVDLEVYAVPDQYEKGEQDGIGTETLTFVPQFDATATTDVQLVVVNASAAIT